MKIGIDICEVGRIGRLIRNKRFLERVYTTEEIAYCRVKRNKAQHFAVRFAAKEAVWKALGRHDVGHRDISVCNRADGRPEVTVRGHRRKNIEISLSHTAEHAIAVAVIR